MKHRSRIEQVDIAVQSLQDIAAQLGLTPEAIRQSLNGQKGRDGAIRKIWRRQVQQPRSRETT